MRTLVTFDPQSSITAGVIDVYVEEGVCVRYQARLSFQGAGPAGLIFMYPYLCPIL